LGALHFAVFFAESLHTTGLADNLNTILRNANVTTPITCAYLGSGGSTVILFGSPEALDQCLVIRTAIVQAIRKGNIQVRVNNVVVAVANEFVGSCSDAVSTTTASSSTNNTNNNTQTTPGASSTASGATTNATSTTAAVPVATTTPRGIDGNVDHTSGSNSSSSDGMGGLSSTALMLVVVASVIVCCTFVLCAVERNRRQASDQQRKEVIDLLKHVHAMSPALEGMSPATLLAGSPLHGGQRQPPPKPPGSYLDGYEEDHAWMTAMRQMVASPASPTLAPWANSPASPVPFGDDSLTWSPAPASVRAASTISGMHRQLGAGSRSMWLPQTHHHEGEEENGVGEPLGEDVMPEIKLTEIGANSAGVYMAIKTAGGPKKASERDVTDLSMYNRQHVPAAIEEEEEEEEFSEEDFDDDDVDVDDERNATHVENDRNKSRSHNEARTQGRNDKEDVVVQVKSNSNNKSVKKQNVHQKHQHQHQQHQQHVQHQSSAFGNDRERDDAGEYEDPAGRLMLAGHTQGSSTLDDVDVDDDGIDSVYGMLRKTAGSAAAGSVYTGKDDGGALAKAFATAMFAGSPRAPSLGASEEGIYERPVVTGNSAASSSSLHAEEQEQPQRSLGLLGQKVSSSATEDEYTMAGTSPEHIATAHVKEVKESYTDEDEYSLAVPAGQTTVTQYQDNDYDMGSHHSQQYDTAALHQAVDIDGDDNYDMARRN
jgi:hypothetical protein